MTLLFIETEFNVRLCSFFRGPDIGYLMAQDPLFGPKCSDGVNASAHASNSGSFNKASLLRFLGKAPLPTNLGSLTFPTESINEWNFDLGR